MKIDMKTKLITTLTALLMLVGISAQAQTGNQTPASAENTDLEGDVNHDGKVDVADVTYIVNLIMKNKSEAKDGTYYWYIGADNPASISDIQTDNTVAGWHEIGASLDGFVLDTNNESNEVILNTQPEYYNYYVVIPNGLGVWDAIGTNLIAIGSFVEEACNITGYKAYKYVEYKVRTVAGPIIKEGTSNEPINDIFYWYIGAENPTSISDIQTDNTKPGWHEIGESLSGFEFDTNNQANWVTLVENATSMDDAIQYYVVIPNGSGIYNASNMNMVEDIQIFYPVTCNIPGYNAYQYYTKAITVNGPIIQECLPVSGLSISTSKSSINVGNTLKLDATVSPYNAYNKNVMWSSSNPEIATVDETTGLVTGVAIGTATITATSVDGGKTATATVEVVETLTGYYWYIGVDNPTTISDIQTDNTKPGWHEIGTSINGFVLETSTNGIVLYTTNTRTPYYVVIPNELYIYDDANDDGLYLFDDAECNIPGYKAYLYLAETRIVGGIIIKESTPVSEVSISTSESSINVGNTIQLEATISPSNATNQDVTWSSSNPEIATVDETTGLVTGVSNGTTTIIATSVDGGKTATTRVEVVETLSNYYWYAGATLPTSISNIQTDNAKPGWHSIGSSLSGFEHDMNLRENWITIVENAQSEADLIHYYIVIPTGVSFKDGLGTNLKTNGDFTKENNFNISGYEAYKSTDTSSRIRGIILKE